LCDYLFFIFKKTAFLFHILITFKTCNKILAMKKLLLTLSVICLFSFNSYSQSSLGSDTIANWSATLSTGSMLLYGDLRQYGIWPMGKTDYPKDISERKCGFGLAVNRKLSPVFSVQGQFQMGKLSGFKREANACFISGFNEWGINGIVNFVKLILPDLENQKISVYGVLGIGLINIKAMQKSISTDEVVISYGYEINGEKQKRTTETVIPIGIGVKYTINNNFDAGIEILMNNVNTDKLDAYVSEGSAKDKYGYTCLTLTYKLPSIGIIGNSGKLENKSNKKEVVGPDADNDGVPDAIDKCPNTPSYALVDANGCPYDADGDGVPDYHDKCPDTPKDLKVDSTGCPVDSDGDKVPDHLDKCPNTPYRVKVDATGCPLDTDGDGIPDYLDKCPNTPKGTKIDMYGCPLESK
jgi:opacity protein-like surface antigen